MEGDVVGVGGRAEGRRIGGRTRHRNRCGRPPGPRVGVLVRGGLLLRGVGGDIAVGDRRRVVDIAVAVRVPRDRVGVHRRGELRRVRRIAQNGRVGGRHPLVERVGVLRVGFLGRGRGDDRGAVIDLAGCVLAGERATVGNPRDRVRDRVVLRRNEGVGRDGGGEVVVVAAGLPGVEGVARLRRSRDFCDRIPVLDLDRLNHRVAVLEVERPHRGGVGAGEIGDRARALEGDAFHPSPVLVREIERAERGFADLERDGLGRGGVVEDHLDVDGGFGRDGDLGGKQFPDVRAVGHGAGPTVVVGRAFPRAHHDGGLRVGRNCRRLESHREQRVFHFDRGDPVRAGRGRVGHVLAVVQVEGQDSLFERADVGQRARGNRPRRVGGVVPHGRLAREGDVGGRAGGRRPSQHRAEGGDQQGFDHVFHGCCSLFRPKRPPGPGGYACGLRGIIAEAPLARQSEKMPKWSNEKPPLARCAGGGSDVAPPRGIEPRLPG